MTEHRVATYFIRRLLLIFPTMIGITLLVFTITRFVPGGAIEQRLQQSAGGGDGAGKRSSSAKGGLSEDQLEGLEERYKLDKPILEGYAQWLGVLPRETSISKGEFGLRGEETIVVAYDPEVTTAIVLKNDGRLVHVSRENGKVTKAVFVESGKPISEEGWKVRYETNEDRQARYKRRNTGTTDVPNYPERAVVFKTLFSGVLQGDLGISDVYNERVDKLILQKVPVAAYFGILSAIITYLVCLPLGVLKALKHRTFIDSASSVLIFLGYSIPGFALGAILLVHLGARMNLFPLFGLTSPEFDQMNGWDKAWDLAHHTALPLLCYLVGSFAMLTMLTKNSLMDNLAADYVRTAVAKGAGFRRAVFGHAFRNSMIPVATTLGGLVEVFVAGSILVETVFDIPGFGLLQYQAILSRDFPLIMGTLTVAAFLMLVGNILSDLIVAMVDPRIKFE